MTRHVGIFFSSLRVTPFLRDVAAAIRDYARAQGTWSLQLFGNIHGGIFEGFAKARIDGAVAIGLLEEDTFLMEGLDRLSVPAVHAGELHGEHPFHEVRSPNRGIGKMGAEYLLGCGLRNFAFVGDNRRNSINRCEGFTDALAAAGHREVVCFLDHNTAPHRLPELLASLPRPVGIMANNDPIGWVVARDAFSLGIRIPDQMALVGTGDEDPWCTLAMPPLSSIVLPSKTIGFEAADMLNNLMNGKPTPTHIDVPSPHVVERESTAAAHARTPEVAQAMRYIRQNFRHGISAKEVAQAVGVSRSTLERGMKQALGRTPLQEILHLRFQEVRDLLTETDLPIKAIAARCGFAKGERLSAAFLSAMGITPTEYRRRGRGQGIE